MAGDHLHLCEECRTPICGSGRHFNLAGVLRRDPKSVFTRSRLLIDGVILKDDFEQGTDERDGIVAVNATD